MGSFLPPDADNMATTHIGPSSILETESVKDRERPPKKKNKKKALTVCPVNGEPCKGKKKECCQGGTCDEDDKCVVDCKDENKDCKTSWRGSQCCSGLQCSGWT